MSRRPSRRSRADTDEEAVFVHTLSNADHLEAVIEKSIRPMLEQEVQTSLRETMVALHLDGTGEQDTKQAVRQTYEDLSRLAENGEELGAEEGGPSRSGAASVISTCCTESAQVLHMQTSDEENEDAGVMEDVAGTEPNQEEGDYENELPSSLDLAEVQSKAQRFLYSISLRPQEAGARNRTRWRGRVLWNQCFYLSLARAYLGHEVRERRVQRMALCLRRAIEAVVLERNPGWASDLAASAEGTGRAMVFADFLPVAMRAETGNQNLLAALVVCILDSVNGHVEVYIGPKYASLQESEKQQNLVLLWYKPWHYQYLVRDDELGSKVAMSYEGFKALLTEHGVVYIETRE